MTGVQTCALPISWHGVAVTLTFITPVGETGKGNLRESGNGEGQAMRRTKRGPRAPVHDPEMPLKALNVHFRTPRKLAALGSRRKVDKLSYDAVS